MHFMKRQIGDDLLLAEPVHLEADPAERAEEFQLLD